MALTDWTFQTSALYYAGGAPVISAPTTIARPQAAAGFEPGYVSLKQSVGGDLREGRIISHVLSFDWNSKFHRCYFLAQTDPALGIPANALIWHANVLRGKFIKRVAGVETDLTIETSWTAHVSGYFGYKISWFNYLSSGMANVQRVIIESAGDGYGTVNTLSVDLDPPLFQASSSNWIGFALWSLTNAKRFQMDNTTVYRRTA